MKRREQIDSSVDAELFLKLREITPPLLLSSYKIENSTLQDLYNKFLVDRQNPVFEYRLPDEQVLLVCREKLVRLREEIIHNHTDKSIQSQYILKIQQYLSTIDILLASKRKDWDAFVSGNRERFGELDSADAAGLIAIRKKKHSIFGDVIFDESSATYPLRVSNKTLLLKQYFDETPFTHIVREQVYSAEEVATLWNEELRKRFPRWSCVVSKQASYVRTDNRSRIVIIPSISKFTGRKVIGLFAHEIGVHVARREYGKASRLQLLSIGMVNSDVSDEGLASMAEQVVGAKVRLGGTDRYIALALALGAVDGVLRDFKDTFALLEEYFYVRYSAQFDETKAQRLSTTGAWKLCVKIFRGGNPSIPGCCMRKEKIYREGSLAMWKVLQEQPEVFALWSKGKFDLTDAEQVDLVRRYT